MSYRESFLAIQIDSRCLDKLLTGGSQGRGGGGRKTCDQHLRTEISSLKITVVSCMEQMCFGL